MALAAAVALTRQMMYRNATEPHPLEAHRVDSLAMFYSSIGDGTEGISAFLEKRPPEFTARASEMPAFYECWIERDSPDCSPAALRSVADS